NRHAPYEILQNKLLDFASLQRLRRFARFWDLVGNSGNFIETTPLLWQADGSSPFRSFLRFADWLHTRVGRTDGIALARLMNLLFDFLTNELGQDPARVAESLWRDYSRGGRKDQPPFLRSHLAAAEPSLGKAARMRGLKRQARHGLARSLNDSNISHA
ncbi:MAG TPA: DUF4080 domain-containing protein, partial [Verrucomicrobiae bacterium]|nr:DUF4080 domain-containing protein [Verrucomicrobiae bacterium]